GPDVGAKPSTLKNGQDAIALNDKFTSLSASTACTDGDLACINGKFAQSGQCTLNRPMVYLSFLTLNINCVALPLVNKPGTTERLRLLQLGQPIPTKLHQRHGPPPADYKVSSGDKKSFTLSNGKPAQALNKQFTSLTPSSSCTAGQNACVNNQFTQCVDGKFVLTGCAGGLQCAVLPLVNSPGTPITCVDNAQAVARIAATGAGSSLTGN
ncbi:hypothetical protein BU17DRAFT_52991, partial [Hysterangium stoloniferum]